MATKMFSYGIIIMFILVIEQACSQGLNRNFKECSYQESTYKSHGYSTHVANIHKCVDQEFKGVLNKEGMISKQEDQRNYFITLYCKQRYTHVAICEYQKSVVASGFWINGDSKPSISLTSLTTNSGFNYNTVDINNVIIEMNDKSMNSKYIIADPIITIFHAYILMALLLNLISQAHFKDSMLIILFTLIASFPSFCACFDPITKIIGGITSEYGYGISVVTSSNSNEYYIAGSKKGAFDQYNAYGARIDNNGNILWEYIFDCNGVSEFFSVDWIAYGGVLFGGRISAACASSTKDLTYFARLSETGTVMWYKYESSYPASGRMSVGAAPNGADFFFTGTKKDDAADKYPFAVWAASNGAIYSSYTYSSMGYSEFTSFDQGTDYNLYGLASGKNGCDIVKLTSDPVMVFKHSINNPDLFTIGGNKLVCCDIKQATGSLAFFVVGHFASGALKYPFMAQVSLDPTDSVVPYQVGNEPGQLRALRVKDYLIVAVGYKEDEVSKYSTFWLVTMDSSANIRYSAQFGDGSNYFYARGCDVVSSYVAIIGYTETANGADIAYVKSKYYCDAGQYYDSVSVSCVKCPAGTYTSAKGQYYCLACNLGSYQDQEGSTQCSPCAVGTIAASTKAIACTPCEAGYYQDQTGGSVCKECEAGKYNSATGKAACTTCPAGNKCPDTKMTAPIPCEAGYFQASTGQASCTACPDGTFTIGLGSKFCSNCHAGQYPDPSDLSICKECEAGTFSQFGYAACVECSVGFYQPSKSSSFCQACPTGTYAAAKGSVSCTSCTPGTFNDQLGQNSCKVCPIGQYSATNKATSCTNTPAGTYQDITGQNNYKSCPSGKYQDLEGQSFCKDCAAGTYANDIGFKMCVECVAGTFAKDPGSKTCTACPAGTFQSSPGKASCDDCALGYYNSKCAQAECLPCPKDSYAGSKGLTACTPCSPGTYAQNPGAAYCTPCSTGTYMPENSPGVCLDCPEGTYNDVVKKTVSCTSCPAGTANPNTKSTTASDCHECPLGTFSSAGSQSCANCLEGTYQDATKQSSCKLCPAGTANGLTKRTDISECIPCNPGYWSLSNSKSCNACKENTYQNLSGRTTCIPCPEHSTSSTGSSKCTCDPGYYSPTEVATTCLPCPANTYQDGSSPYKCILCPLGHYQPDTGSAVCIKLNCGQFCQDCTNPETCTKCDPTNAGVILKNGACLCEAAGFSFAINPVTQKPSCVKCHPLCSSCYGNSNSECKACSSEMNAVLVKDSICQCKVGYFYEDARMSCSPCSELCKECNGPLFYNCLSCNKKTSIPVENEPNKCVASCEIGFYKDTSDQPICKRIFRLSDFRI